MARYLFTVDIPAPRDFLFDLLTDPERTGDWTAGVTKVTDISGDAEEPGSTYRLLYGSLEEKVEVLAAERPVYFRARSRFAGISYEMSVTLESIDTGTRVRQAWWTRSVRSRLWLWLMAKGSFGWSFRTVLVRFAAVAEREYRANPVEPELLPLMNRDLLRARRPTAPVSGSPR